MEIYGISIVFQIVKSGKFSGISQNGNFWDTPNRKLLELFKFYIFRIFQIARFCNFPNWSFLEFSKLQSFEIRQFGNFWNFPNWKFWEFFWIKNFGTFQVCITRKFGDSRICSKILKFTVRNFNRHPKIEDVGPILKFRALRFGFTILNFENLKFFISDLNSVMQKKPDKFS